MSGMALMANVPRKDWIPHSSRISLGDHTPEFQCETCINGDFECVLHCFARAAAILSELELRKRKLLTGWCGRPLQKAALTRTGSVRPARRLRRCVSPPKSPGSL